MGRNSIENVLKPLERFPGINRIELPYDLNSLFNAFRLINFSFGIKEKNIHITGDVHYMAAFLFWKKSIITVHDCNHYEQLHGLRKFLYGLIWFRLPFFFSNQIVAISPFTKSQLRQHFNVPERKIHVIPNAISKDVTKKHRTVDYFDRTFTILVIGTSHNKNIERLILAVSNQENLQLDIVGKLGNSIIELMRTHNISYVNSYGIPKSTLKKKYLASDLLFFASTKEGFGLPILEAQNYGLPVISSTTTSMPYVAGEGAILVNPYDIDSIRKAIKEVRSNADLRLELVQKGYQNLNRFNVNVFVNEYRSLYSKIFN